jgi:hypothetical protein
MARVQHFYVARGNTRSLASRAPPVHCGPAAHRAVSSAGRASRLHREGRRFEPVTAHHIDYAIVLVNLTRPMSASFLRLAPDCAPETVSTVCQTRSRDHSPLVKAGLRACEIARLDWTMVLGARGQVGAFVAVRNAIAKSHSGRRIPLHGDLRRALVRLKGRRTPSGPVICSARGSAMRPNSIVNWFIALFEALESKAAHHIQVAAVYHSRST